MTKKALLILFAVVIGLAISTPVMAQEKIDRYEVTIQINQDASIDVSETIDYNFGDAEKRGIFRYLPVIYEDYMLLIDSILVEKENSQPWDFVEYKEGDNHVIRIGNPDIFLTGTQTYVIKYKIKQAIGYFSDHDELYWNAIGSEWMLPVSNAKVTVLFSKTFSDKEARFQCYAGFAGSKDACDESQFIYTEYPGQGYGFIFSQKELEASEGFTIVAGWPKGEVIEPEYLIKPEEQISAWEAEFNIQPDGKILVQEIIDYNFGINDKTEISLNIPLEHSNNFWNNLMSINNFKAYDSNNQELAVVNKQEGKYSNIIITNNQGLFSGREVFKLAYEVGNAFDFFSDSDKFEWSLKKGNFTLPVSQSRINVKLPKTVSEDKLEYECQLSSGASCQSSGKVSTNGEVSGLEIGQQNLDALTDITFSINLPKGVIKEPILFEKIALFSSANYELILSLFAPLLAFIFVFRRWQKYGRDPEGRGTIIAQFDSPDNLSPVEVGAILDEEVNKHDLSAEIVWLATRGYLKIVRLKDKDKFREEDYILFKLKPADEDLAEWQKKILEVLFKNPMSETDKKKVVESLTAERRDENLIKEVENFKSLKPADISLLKDCNKYFFQELNNITEKVYKNLVDKKYFIKNPKAVKASYMTAGILLIVGSFFFGGVFLPLFIGGAVTGILLVFFSRFMPQRTLAGVTAREHILGLKQYLKVAEKDRLEFHNAPEKNPELFEKLLPFAMVLEVEEKWAEEFKDIYETEPEWYNSGSSDFSISSFSSNINKFSNVAYAAAATSPYTSGGGRYSYSSRSTGSSRGSSGFSGGGGFSSGGGGGSSGGGFGGGGGKSW